MSATARRHRPSLLEVDDVTETVPRPGPRADRHPGDRPRPTPAAPRTILLLGSDDRYEDKKTGAQAALGHDPARPRRPGQGRDRRSCRSRATSRSRSPATAATRSTPPSSTAAQRPDRAHDQEALRGRDGRGLPDQQRDQRRLRRLPAGRRLHRRRLRRHRPRLLQRQLVGGERYAAIDINPGYQKLKGKDALDYVRYRHTDNDLIRAARQQDFLRQARSQSGVQASCFQVGERKKLARAFGRYFTVDKSFRSNKEIFSMLKLALYLVQREPERQRGPLPRRTSPTTRRSTRGCSRATRPAQDRRASS